MSISSKMSSVVLRRLAMKCRPASSIYHGRNFTTSPSLFAETNSSNANTENTSSDAPRTITLIPGRSDTSLEHVWINELLCLGDGIGPEIAVSVQKIFEAAGVPLNWEPVDVTPVKSVWSAFDEQSLWQFCLSLGGWKISNSCSSDWISNKKSNWSQRTISNT